MLPFDALLELKLLSTQFQYVEQSSSPYQKQIVLLQIITIVWMSAEAAIALFAALRAHSLALLGFGADSGIELVSAPSLPSGGFPSSCLSHRTPAEQCYSPLCRLNRVFWGHMGDQSRDRLIARQRRRPGRKVQFQLFAEFRVVIQPAPCCAHDLVAFNVRVNLHVAVCKTLYYVQKYTAQLSTDWRERLIKVFSR